MPGEVLNPGATKDEDRPVAGFFGKLPATGDFVSRGLPDAFRRNWDGWLTRHIAPLQHRGADFPPGGLRFRLVSGGRLATGVILPSHDSAGRRYPLSLLMIAERDLPRPGVNAWCDAALTQLTDGVDPETLWQALDALPAPMPEGPAAGPMQLWALGQPALDTDPSDPAAALSRLLGT
jgi:type VI secretion system protein ImpM